MAGKFIVLSDIHLNLWAYGHPEDRLDDQIEAINTVMEHAHEENVDAVLWTGDIFHTQGQVHTQVLRKLYTVLRNFRDDLSHKTVFLPGNHDMVYRDHSDCHALDFLSQFGRVAQVQHATAWCPVLLPNMPPIWSFPYTDQHAHLSSWLSLFDSRDNDLLLMHQGVRGVDFQSRGFVLDEGLAADMIPPGVFHAFVGHCHSLRRVSHNMTVPGALQQHNFGDSGDARGYLMVEYSESGLSFQQHEVGGTRFITVPYLEDLQLLRDHVAEAEPEFTCDFLRITDVPVSKVEEVRAWTKGMGSHDIKITTAAAEHVPLAIQQNEIGDIDSLLRRFGKENDVDPALLNVGQEILKGVNSGVS